jgi:excisionase family DNA binding protein
MPIDATAYAEQLIAKQITKDQIPPAFRDDVQEILLARFRALREAQHVQAPPVAEDAPGLVTIDEAARTAKVQRRTIYNWLEAGKLRHCYTVGGSVRIDPASLFTTERP